MSGFFQLRSFLTYWLEAVDDHSLHSPFMFDLYTKVIKKENHLNNDTAELIRQKLLKDQRIIDVEDMGAGSVYLKQRERKIADIAQTSLTRKKFSRLYANLIQYFSFKYVVELGSSFGINTLYLTRLDDTQVYTLEGSESIANIADSAFKSANKKNIHLVRGNIDKTLPRLLETIPQVDFALLDANHQYHPTITYFNSFLNHIKTTSVLVIDDIYSSKAMANAWQQIKTHKLVYGSVDLFRCGLIFFDPSLNRQHVVLQF